MSKVIVILALFGLVSNSVLAYEFTICRGDEKRKCGTDAVYVGCGDMSAARKVGKGNPTQEVVSKAKEICDKMGSSQEAPKMYLKNGWSGDHCGYGFWQVVCS
tara:strand:+ start:344 stop:652 length:309 start_codon:yes stop_codon:yes gene_type:complete